MMGAIDTVRDLFGKPDALHPSCLPQTPGPDWRETLALGGGLVFVFLVVLYLLARLLKAEVTEETAKDEAMNVLTELGLFVLLFSFLQAAPSVLTLETQDHRQISYLDYGLEVANRIRISILARINRIILYLLIFNLSANMVPMSGGAQLVAVPLQQVIGIIGSIFQILLRYLSTAMGVWIVLFELLCIVSKWGLKIFLPLGFLLRILRASKNLGGFVIALVISLYLILPFVLVLEDYLLGLMGFKKLDVELYGETQTVYSVGKEPSVISFGKKLMTFMMITFVIIARAKEFPYMSAKMLKWAYFLLHGLGVPFLLAEVTRTVVFVIITVVFFSALNFFITVFAFREISEKLKAEVDLSVFSQLL